MSDKDNISYRLKNCGKAGCIRILAASTVENRLGVEMSQSIVLSRPEALGLYALATTYLAERGDRFISDMSGETAIECAREMDRATKLVRLARSRAARGEGRKEAGDE